MKRYGQRCAVARALDVVGERWTPLILRELLLGPKRYTDLADALPGIGSNILAARLSDLQAHGVVVKRTLAPPTPVAVYELTEAGEALAPVIGELRRWGQRYAPPAEAGDAVRSGWIIQTAAAGGELARGRVYEVRVGDETFQLTGDPDGTTVKAGVRAVPDAVVTIEPDLLKRLVAGVVKPGQARSAIGVEGDPALARELVQLLAGSLQ